MELWPPGPICAAVEPDVLPPETVCGVAEDADVWPVDETWAGEYAYSDAEPPGTT